MFKIIGSFLVVLSLSLTGCGGEDKKSSTGGGSSDSVPAQNNENGNSSMSESNLDSHLLNQTGSIFVKFPEGSRQARQITSLSSRYEVTSQGGVLLATPHSLEALIESAEMENYM